MQLRLKSMYIFYSWITGSGAARRPLAVVSILIGPGGAWLGLGGPDSDSELMEIRVVILVA